MTRRRAKAVVFFGAALTALIGALHAASLWFAVQWIGALRGGTGSVVVGAGVVGVVWSPRSISEDRLGVNFSSIGRPHVSFWLPGRSGAYYAVPLWMPFFVTAAPTIFLVCRSRRDRPGHCVSCGYNLTGAPSPTCPECGKPAA